MDFDQEFLSIVKRLRNKENAFTDAASEFLEVNEDFDNMSEAQQTHWLSVFHFFARSTDMYYTR